ncbi:MAG: hypothetical protein K9L30_16390 [Desulfobacterales bacterium]|nr:hypothetical protein [Desulfobacterales bacterium]
MSVKSRYLILSILFFIIFTSPASALDTSFSVTPLYQGDTDMDGGGELSVDRNIFRLGFNQEVNDTFKTGIKFSYDVEDYEFAGNSGFAGLSPWDTINRIGVDLDFKYIFSDALNIVVSPSLYFAAESGVDLNDGLTYGVSTFAMYRYRKDLMLGAGFGAFRDIEEKRFFPFLMIHWQITEKLRLSNPLRTIPAGPAGLELAYNFGKQWEAAFGATYRSYRFRLDNNDVAPEGVGQVDFIPVFARLSKGFGKRLNIDLYAGSFADGKLSIENEDGNDIASDHYDPAPMIGLSLTARF